MATQGTPNGGLDDIASLAYSPGLLTLVAYTNAANSLGPTTTAASLTQPTVANGYAPIVLNGSWTSTNGVLVYDHPGFPTWSATGAWSATVTGIALIRGGVCRHFKDLSSPFIAAANKKLAVNLLEVLS